MLSSRNPPQPGTFCWLDLAASDAGLAQMFYAQAFGWAFSDQPVLGGRFPRCHVGSREVGSLYQLKQAQLVVAPFDLPGLARIALIQDAVGALVGLWQPIRESPAANEP